MNGRDAYEDEMAFLRRLNFEDEDVAGFALALRASLPRDPDPSLTATIVPRLARTARASGNGASATAPAAITFTEDAARAGGRRPRRRLALVARIALAVALLPLLSAGLAVAGVRVPDAAVQAFESVGVSLPNQADSGGDDGSGRDARPGKGKDASGGAGEARGADGNGKASNGQGPPPSSPGGGPPAHSNAGGKGGGSANAHGGNPNAKGGNPNAGGGNPNAGGANRPDSPSGQSKGSGTGSSGKGGGQGQGKGQGK